MVQSLLKDPKTSISCALGKSVNVEVILYAVDLVIGPVVLLLCCIVFGLTFRLIPEKYIGTVRLAYYFLKLAQVACILIWCVGQFRSGPESMHCRDLSIPTETN